MKNCGSSSGELTESVPAVVDAGSPVDLSVSTAVQHTSIRPEVRSATAVLTQLENQSRNFHLLKGGKQNRSVGSSTKSSNVPVDCFDKTFLDFIREIEPEAIIRFTHQASVKRLPSRMDEQELVRQEHQIQKHEGKMTHSKRNPVGRLALELEYKHSTGQMGGRMFYCKLCCLESTRARAHTFFCLEEGVKHLQNHWRPTKQQRGPPIRKNKVPPELYYRKQAVNVEEDVALLAKLYLGSKAQERKPYRCGLCTEGFASTSDRYHHVGSEHLEASTPLLCCGAAFQNRDKYVQHMFFKHCDFRRQDDKGSFFICELCFVAFDNRTDLEWHFYQHNQHVANPVVEGTNTPYTAPSQFFRCTLCSDQCILSRRKPAVFYTLSESFSHLGWHWIYQIPPEIRQNPVLMFEDDADVIHKLYMEPVMAREWRRGLCPLQLNKEHVRNYHCEGRKVFRCATCKNTLQFAKLEDFVGHIFMQHTQVLKGEEVFLCLICNHKFENRNQVKWHCYIHNVTS